MHSVKNLEKKISAYKTSYAQKRMWILHKIEPESSFYNTINTDSIKGDIDIAILKNSLDFLVRRYESLRTNFLEIDGELLQVIREKNDFNLKFTDISRVKPEKNRKKKEEEIINEVFKRPFNLESDSLIRVAIIKISKEEHTLVVVMHHIITDWWSFVVFYRDLRLVYNSYLIGKKPFLSPLQLQHKDYSAWEQSKEGRTVFKKKEKYWLKKFSGRLPVLDLPTDKPRPAIQTYIGSTEIAEIKNELLEKIKLFCRKNNITIFTFLFSVFNVFLYRLSGQDDIIIGTPFFGQRTKEFEGVIGLFMNNLPIRTNLSADLAFADLVKSNRNVIMEAMANQDYSQENLVEQLKLDRDLSRAPIYSVMFQCDPEIQTALKLGNCETTHKNFYNNTTKFDLKVRFSSFSQSGSFLYCEYNTDLFHKNTIKTYLRSIMVLIRSALNNPDKRISDLEMIAEEEKHKLIHEFNNTKKDYPQNKTLPELFEEQVKRTPDNIAVEYEGKRLTYRELNNKANQLAGYLINSKKIKNGDVIGVDTGRSLNLPTAIMGIHKAGGCVLVINTNFPEERIEFMLKIAKVKLVLFSESRDDDRFSWFKGRETVFLDDAIKENTDDYKKIANKDDPAYIFFTSGSTGEPKGAAITHRGVINQCYHRKKKMKIGPDDILCNTMSVGFITLSFQLHTPLLTGAKLIIYPEEIIKNYTELFKRADKEKVSILDIPFSIFLPHAHFLAAKDGDAPELKKLKFILPMGEKIDKEAVRIFLEYYPDIVVVNNYGMTENSGPALDSFFSYGKNGARYNPTKPVQNIQTYILDQNKKLLPIGIPGELYISGDGLAQGYLNDPEKTKSVFLPHPFLKGERIYKTGDLAKMHEDGNIEILGRLDHQIKIRGYRIEPGEIEANIKKIRNIKESVVTKHEEALVAYYTTADKKSLKTDIIRTSLKKILPDYMIPAYFIFLPKFHLNANGKLDRKALPKPEEKDLSKNKYEAPRGVIEEKLAQIWREVLGVKKISRHDNFFDLGGHSLRAIRLLSQINRELAVDLPLKDIFQHPVLLNLAESIGKEVKVVPAVINPAPKQEYYPLSKIQKVFWSSARSLDRSTLNNLKVIEYAGDLDIKALEEALREIVNRHEVLQINFYEKDEQVAQFINSGHKFKLEFIDVSRKKHERKKTKKAFWRFIKNKYDYRFNLERDLLFRASLLKVNKDKYYLILVTHVINTDYTSLSVITRELRLLYDYFVNKTPYPLKPLGINYTDYLLFVTKKDLSDQEKYWLDKLSDGYPIMNLPIDSFAPRARKSDTNVMFIILEEELAVGINEICKAKEATHYMFFLAALNIFLSVLTKKNDLLVGASVDIRNNEDTLNLVGSLITTLGIRSNVREDEVFFNFLLETKRILVEAIANGDIPFSYIVEKNNIPVPPGRILTNVSLRLNYIEEDFLLGQNGEVASRFIALPFKNTPFDIKLLISIDKNDNNKMIMSFIYNGDLFCRKTAKKLFEIFQSLLLRIVSQPEAKISDLKKYLSDIYEK